MSESNLPFVPRSLAISSPPGKDVYEFYLIVKNDPEIFGSISNVFTQKGAEILGAHLQLTNDRKSGNVIFYVEMAEARVDAFEIVELLKRNKLVIEATASQRNRVFFEANMFPPTSGGHYRVFIMGAESWINLVSTFKRKFGSPADSILYSQGVSAGIEMAIGIESRVGPKEKEAGPKLANLKGLFRATGLGLLEINGHRDNFDITISESMGSNTEIIDNFLVGVIAGALGRLFSKEYAVSELKHIVKRSLTTFRLT